MDKYSNKNEQNDGDGATGAAYYFPFANGTTTFVYKTTDGIEKHKMRVYIFNIYLFDFMNSNSKMINKIILMKMDLLNKLGGRVHRIR